MLLETWGRDVLWLLRDSALNDHLTVEQVLTICAGPQSSIITYQLTEQPRE